RLWRGEAASPSVPNNSLQPSRTHRLLTVRRFAEAGGHPGTLRRIFRRINPLSIHESLRLIATRIEPTHQGPSEIGLLSQAGESFLLKDQGDPADLRCCAA